MQCIRGAYSFPLVLLTAGTTAQFNYSVRYPMTIIEGLMFYANSFQTENITVVPFGINALNQIALS